MGDTVVKAIADLVNWAGSLTILPGENGAKAALRSAAERVSQNSFKRGGNFQMAVPGRPLPYQAGDNTETEKKLTVQEHAMNRLSSLLEEEELKEAKEAGKHGDSTQRDMHLYHYILSREIRNLMKDVEASPPKTYSYHDWAWYLKLLGQDEQDASRHRRAPAKPDQPSQDAGKELEYLGQASGTNDDLTWSWLGTRSPLMGNKAEAEWLLEKMSAALERELYNMHSGKASRRKPPISFDDILNKEEERTGPEGAREVDEAVDGKDDKDDKDDEKTAEKQSRESSKSSAEDRPTSDEKEVKDEPSAERE
jgi:potassium channel subfamily K